MGLYDAITFVKILGYPGLVIIGLIVGARCYLAMRDDRETRR